VIFRNAIHRPQQNFGSPLVLIIAVLRDNSIQFYSAVKQALDAFHGVASQVMIASNTATAQQIFISNLILHTYASRSHSLLYMRPLFNVVFCPEKTRQ
jgi:hypothetical protein